MVDDIVIRLRDSWRDHDPLSVDAADEIERLRAERDAERALADQLAGALLDGPFRGDRRDRMYGSGWADVHDALDAWQEARRG